MLFSVCEHKSRFVSVDVNVCNTKKKVYAIIYSSDGCYLETLTHDTTSKQIPTISQAKEKITLLCASVWKRDGFQNSNDIYSMIFSITVYRFGMEIQKRDDL